VGRLIQSRDGISLATRAGQWRSQGPWSFGESLGWLWARASIYCSFALLP